MNPATPHSHAEPRTRKPRAKLTVRLAAGLAAATGATLIVAETLFNWGDWQLWPFVVIDYVMSGLLIAGAFVALRTGATALLAGGWGVSAGVIWLSFFSHMFYAAPHPDFADTVSAPMLIGLKAVLFVIAWLGLALSVWPDREKLSKPEMQNA
ncbi:MAG: hypothetical protein ACFB2Z_09235 [Maricaulaceae bacterium]